MFWKRWIREYIPVLQLKQKWLRPRPSLAVGDLVLVVDEASPRGFWPKGIVQEVFPDKHGFGLGQDGLLGSTTRRAETLPIRRGFI